MNHIVAATCELNARATLVKLIVFTVMILGLSGLAHAEAEDLTFTAIFDAIDTNEFKTAADLAEQRQKAFKKSGDAALVKAAEFVQKYIRDLDKEYKAIQAKLKAARPVPEPDEKLELGRFECFTKRNWNAGLPLLASCQNAAFEALANTDLEAPTKPNDQHALAEKWRQSAEKAGPHADGMNQRAAFWELKALKGLEPKQRAMAELWLVQRQAKKIRTDGRVEVDPIEVIRALPLDQLSKALNLQFSSLALGSDWGPSTNRAGTYVRVYGSVVNGSSVGQIKDSIRCSVRALCVNGDKQRVVVDFGGEIRIAQQGTQKWNTDSSRNAYVNRIKYHNANDWIPKAVHVQIEFEKVTVYEAFLQVPDPRWGIWWMDDSLIGITVN